VQAEKARNKCVVSPQAQRPPEAELSMNGVSKKRLIRRSLFCNSLSFQVKMTGKKIFEKK